MPDAESTEELDEPLGETPTAIGVSVFEARAS